MNNFEVRHTKQTVENNYCLGINLRKPHLVDITSGEYSLNISIFDLTPDDIMELGFEIIKQGVHIKGVE